MKLGSLIGLVNLEHALPKFAIEVECNLLNLLHVDLHLLSLLEGLSKEFPPTMMRVARVSRVARVARVARVTRVARVAIVARVVRVTRVT